MLKTCLMSCLAVVIAACAMTTDVLADQQNSSSSVVVTAPGAAVEVATQPQADAPAATDETEELAPPKRGFRLNVPGVRIENGVIRAPGVIVKPRGADGPSVTVQTPPAQQSIAPVSPYWIGMVCGPVSDLVARQLRLPENQGLVVESVMPGSPAAKAGFQEYDVLLRAEDTNLTTVANLVEAIAASGGEEVEIVLMREGSKQTIQVTPEKRPVVAGGTIPQQADPEDWNRVQNWMQRVQPGMQPVVPAQPGVPGQPQIRMWRTHPGVIVPNGAPGAQVQSHMMMQSQIMVGDEKVDIKIDKQGDEPASIEAKKNNDSWQVTEETMDKLPEDIREQVQKMLDGMSGGPKVDIRIAPLGDPNSWFRRPMIVPGIPPMPHAVPQIPGVMPGLPAMPTIPAVPDEDLDQQMQRVQEQMKSIQQQLEQLREQRAKQIEELQKQIQEEDGKNET